MKNEEFHPFRWLFQEAAFAAFLIWFGVSFAIWATEDSGTFAHFIYMQILWVIEISKRLV